MLLERKKFIEERRRSNFRGTNLSYECVGAEARPLQSYRIITHMANTKSLDGQNLQMLNMCLNCLNGSVGFSRGVL
jgi:hypothetical protein